MHYRWLTLIVLGLRMLMHRLGIFAFRGDKKKADQVILGLGIFVCVIKGAEFIYYQIIGQHFNIPAEFSALSYFIFGIVAITRKQKLYNFAAFAGFLAGLVYNIVFILATDAFVLNREYDRLLISRILTHNAVYLGALLLMSNYLFKKKDVWLLPVGSLLCVIWACIVKFVLHSPANLKIISVLNASVFQETMNGIAIQGWGMKTVYYICIVLVFSGMIRVTYRLNKVLYRLNHPSKV